MLLYYFHLWGRRILYFLLTLSIIACLIGYSLVYLRSDSLSIRYKHLQQQTQYPKFRAEHQEHTKFQPNQIQKP